MRRGRIAANVARRLFAIHDCSVSEDHGNAVTGIGRFFRLIVVEADGAVILLLFTPAELFSQRFFNLGAGTQGIHQLSVQGILRGIPLDFTQSVQNPLRTREDLLRGDLTVRSNGAQVVFPQFADPAAVCFAGSRGHVVADKRLNGRFIGADTEHVGGDFQLIEQRFVIEAIGGKAMQIDGALRREPHFIGEACQIVLPLAVVIAHRNDRFAAVAELAQRFTDVLHGRLIRPGEVLQIEHDAGNVTVIFRLTNGIDDIKQRVFLQTVATGAKQLATQHAKTIAGGGFIDHDPSDIQQKRTAAGVLRLAGGAEVHPDAHANHQNKDEEDVHHQIADEIKQSPRPFKKAGKQSPEGSHVFSLSR